jgi:23S rRNA (guanosine2251-2'-O)-methyltransferase
VEVVWLSADAGGGRAGRIIEAARHAGVRFATVPRRKLDDIAASTAHNGFAARVAPVPLVDPEVLLASAGPVCLVGLDGLEDPHNLGAVIRLCAGLGLGGVVVAGPHPPPLGGAVAKVAAGTLPLVPLAHVGSLGDFARAAKDRGFWVYGADVDGGPVQEVDFAERALICVGGEAAGLRAKTRRQVDVMVGIPLAEGIESLNLAVATGILCWEWRRRVRPSAATSS